MTDGARGGSPGRTGDDPATVLRTLGWVLAHELRTPLTTIYAGAELLTRDRLSEAGRAEAARSVARESYRLHAVIEDLIVLVRDAQTGQEREPVLVQRLLTTEVDARRDAEPERPIELRIEHELPPVLAVPSEVVHALRNLVEHAVQNSPPGGTVEVDARRRGGTVEVEVRDDGRGLGEAEAAVAFDLLAASPRDGGDPSGANLRLVAVRRLVERAGGTVRAVSSDRGDTIAAWPALT